MKAGDLRHPIVLLRPEDQIDDRGRRTVRWQQAAQVYAAKADVSGREYYIAQAYQAERTVTFTLRWRDDVQETWRIRHGGITYEIKEINHLGYKRDFIRVKTLAISGEGV